MSGQSERTVRRASSRDVEAIRRLVSAVVAETYGHLLPGGAPLPDGDWQRSCVIEIGGEIAGVALADGDTIEDLWVSSEHRARGVGSDLLAAAETEIARCGHGAARLRVVAENGRARRFYAARGWEEIASHPHEAWGFPIVDMVKRLAP